MASHPDYKAVVFDYGGVVSQNFNWQEFIEKLPQLNNFTDFRQLVKALTKEWTQATAGGSTAPFWQRVSKLTGQSETQLKQYFIEKSQPQPEMLTLIGKLRPDYQVGLLSNQIADWLEPIIKQHQLERLFDPLVASYQVKMVKPNPDIYELVSQKLGLSYPEIIFVDDLERNVLPAQELGMTGIVYKNYSQFLRELAHLNIKV